MDLLLWDGNIELKLARQRTSLICCFYHIHLHCYVVVEVKVTEFESSYAGQLGTYVVAVNHQLKTEKDEPTLGLLVCKSKDDIKSTVRTGSKQSASGCVSI